MSVRIGFIIAAVVIFAFVYFFLANAYVYHRIHVGNLVFPRIETRYEFPGRGAKITYVALGDSLTAGVGAATYEESYPYLVARKLGENNATTFVPLAYPGFRSSDILARDVEAAVAQKPDIVTLLIGTNDIHGRIPAKEFERNYRAILEKLVETDADIYAVSIPYIGSNTLFFPVLRSYFDYKTREFNAIVKSLAAEYGATYIDIATPSHDQLRSDGEHYASDSFHPSGVGYAPWADIIYATISP